MQIRPGIACTALSDRAKACQRTTDKRRSGSGKWQNKAIPRHNKKLACVIRKERVYKQILNKQFTGSASLQREATRARKAISIGITARYPKLRQVQKEKLRCIEEQLPTRLGNILQSHQNTGLCQICRIFPKKDAMREMSMPCT